MGSRMSIYFLLLYCVYFVFHKEYALFVAAEDAEDCWKQRNGEYIREGHGQTNECYTTLAEAKNKCLAAGDCRGIATQSNICGGQFRVTHGGPTFVVYELRDWRTISMRSYELICRDDWIIAQPSDNCDEACKQRGLVCSEQELKKHNEEVDSCEELKTLLKRLGDLEMQSCDVKNGARKGAPALNTKKSIIFASSIDRPLSSYNCKHSTRAEDKRRICFCHGNFSSTSVTSTSSSTMATSSTTTQQTTRVAATVPTTCYVPGDGLGKKEKNLGTAANREECITMVKARETTANGATFPSRAGPGSCYAEFGMTGPNSSREWQTCLFARDVWKKKDKWFCPYCNTTYDTMMEARFGLENVNGQVIYDIFCDGVGYFCTCPYDAIKKQTHPKGIDCLYIKDGSRKKRRNLKEEL